MFRKLAYIICFVVVLGLLSSVSTAEPTWTHSSGTGDWNAPATWVTTEVNAIPTWNNNYTVPNNAIVAGGVVNVTGGTVQQGTGRCTIGSGATVNAYNMGVGVDQDFKVGLNLTMGYAAGVSTLNIIGSGTTAFCEQLQLGVNAGCSGIINVDSGAALTVGWWGCFVGMAGTGTVNLTGTGYMLIWDAIDGLEMTSNGHINIEAGYTQQYASSQYDPCNVYLSRFLGYANGGLITGYGGSRKVTVAKNGDWIMVTAAAAPMTVVTVQNVTAASAFDGSVPALNTTNGSGMTGDYHNKDYFSTWMTSLGGGGSSNPNPGTEPGATWIRYDFSGLYNLTSLWVWNYNEWTGRGLKDVVIEYTSDGTTWKKLGEYQIAKAPSEPNGYGYNNYAHNTTVYFNNALAKSVVITAKGGAGVGNWGDSGPYYGLSEVRFYGTAYANPHASEPNPVNGTIGMPLDTTLSWTAGTGAQSHNVYFGTTSPGTLQGNQTEKTFNPGTLAAGAAYYWRIDEVNGPNTVTGTVWSFATGRAASQCEPNGPCAGLETKTHAAVLPLSRNTFSGWPERHAAILNQINDQNELIFIGDSITQAWEASGLSVWNQYYAPHKAVNMGFSGDMTQNVLWRLYHGELEGISPKLAIVLIGTNNTYPPLGQVYTAEDIADGIKAVCCTIRRKLPNTKILIMAIFPRGQYPSPERDKNAAASILASQIADGKTIFYMDINSHFLDLNGTLSSSIFPDFIHPNAAGYLIWAQAMEPTIQELMGE